ncbi:MFS transporter [Undibacterium sp. LX40W]|uniref:MFS transporter n=1 Tax=Undibacterium nitidum TaxID=2762298 RepID=A0A923HN55_9BURK|nr:MULTISPECIES: MFS transporter [Undibacterium]MBC3881443.1 MFS transporter [Undibacterium nitidum]MBC3891774.1 MFS transporter [Undibacterium sp. LX40W]
MQKTKGTRIPTSIWTLGLVSMLMDISSEMIHSLLPVFMVTSLGMSVMIVGLIDGIAESTTLIVKVFSGALSDKLGKRKALAVIGYGLSAFSKPFFAIAQGLNLLLFARLSDRIGKGIRGAPRDALIADITPPDIRGAAFGLRQSLDTIGAVAGPLLASGLMIMWANDFRLVFWLAAIPGFAAMFLLLFGIQEPKTVPLPSKGFPLQGENLKRLQGSYWSVVILGGLFTLARFSEAFLLLRAQQLQIPLPYIPLVMVIMNLIYASSAYPFGQLSDRLAPRTLLSWGLLILIAADLLFAFSISWQGLIAGVILWGVHMGMTQGLLSSMVATHAPADLRGTAFGMFNLVSGVCLLVASLIAGLLWENLGAKFTFLAGAIFATASLVWLLLNRKTSS